MVRTTLRRSPVEVCNARFNIAWDPSAREVVLLSNDSIFLKKHLMIRVPSNEKFFFQIVHRYPVIFFTIVLQNFPCGLIFRFGNSIHDLMPVIEEGLLWALIIKRTLTIPYYVFINVPWTQGMISIWKNRGYRIDQTSFAINDEKYGVRNIQLLKEKQVLVKIVKPLVNCPFLETEGG